jgi:FKBP-type peptidyl-prolyl cis-trans isomerase
MKLRLLAAAVAALALGSAAAFAQTTPAPARAPAAAAAPADKATLSYALGYEWGANLAESKADLDINGIIRAVQDGYAKRPPTMPAEKLGAALQQFGQKMATQQKAEVERVSRENKTKSDAFLAANRAKSGVTVLPGSGIQYRVIDAGAGPKPGPTSEVSVNLMGSISTGQMFTNSYNGPEAGPVKLKVNELPKGLQTVLQMMPVGSRWEVVLPPDQAYGNDPRGPGGPGQAAKFDIQLISSK